jgi:hypothetical protein
MRKVNRNLLQARQQQRQIGAVRSTPAIDCNLAGSGRDGRARQCIGPLRVVRVDLFADAPAPLGMRPARERKCSVISFFA